MDNILLAKYWIGKMKTTERNPVAYPWGGLADCRYNSFDLLRYFTGVCNNNNLVDEPQALIKTGLPEGLESQCQSIPQQELKIPRSCQSQIWLESPYLGRSKKHSNPGKRVCNTQWGSHTKSCSDNGNGFCLHGRWLVITSEHHTLYKILRSQTSFWFYD